MFVPSHLYRLLFDASLSAWLWLWEQADMKLISACNKETSKDSKVTALDANRSVVYLIAGTGEV